MVFNEGCQKVLNTHAPVIKKTIRELETAPWFDSEYKQLRIRRRKAEKKWRKSSKNMYDSLRQKCIDLAKLKEAKYYKDKFEKYDYSQKTLFKFAEIFLDQSPELILPSTEDIQTVVNEFNSYFTDKIDHIRKNMSKTPVLNYNESGKQFSFPNSNPSNSKLKTLTPTTIDELRSIIHETGLKTSTNDPLPKSMIGDDIEFWLPYLCDLVNCSLNSGT